jgi:hypothetical protein
LRWVQTVGLRRPSPFTLSPTQILSCPCKKSPRKVQSWSRTCQSIASGLNLAFLSLAVTRLVASLIAASMAIAIQRQMLGKALQRSGPAHWTSCLLAKSQTTMTADVRSAELNFTWFALGGRAPLWVSWRWHELHLGYAIILRDPGYGKSSVTQGMCKWTIVVADGQ